MKNFIAFLGRAARRIYMRGERNRAFGSDDWAQATALAEAILDRFGKEEARRLAGEALGQPELLREAEYWLGHTVVRGALKQLAGIEE